MCMADSNPTTFIEPRLHIRHGLGALHPLPGVGTADAVTGNSYVGSV